MRSRNGLGACAAASACVGAALLALGCGMGLTGPDPDKGLPLGWADSTLVVAVGDRVSFSASRTIDMWPNCEDTKVAEGYPDIDCHVVHHMGPDGTDLFPLGMGDYPMPGAKVMVLVARVGDGPAFLVGKKATVVMQQAGALRLTANDPDWRKEDDKGWYRVEVKGPKGTVAIAVR
jgi:hypothetical protein